MPKRNIKWDSIESDWKQGKEGSQNALAKHHGIARSTLSEKAKKDGWGEFGADRQSAITVMTEDNADKASKILLGAIATRKLFEFKRELGLHYSSLDESSLVILAASYEEWVQLKEKTIRAGGIEHVSEKVAKRLTSLEKTIPMISRDFGFTLSSRKRLELDFNDDEKLKELDRFDLKRGFDGNKYADDWE